MSRLMISLFGAFQVMLDGEPLKGFRSDKSRALLTYLIIEHDRPHRREALATLLWPESRRRHARASLRSVLHNLRQALAPLITEDDATSLLIITRKDVQFNAAHPTCWVDKFEFDALLIEHKAHPHQGDLHEDACVQRMTRIAQLYRGNLLSGFTLHDSPDFEEWQMVQQEIYHRKAMSVLNQLAHHYHALGEYGQMAEYAQRQIALEPWREAPHRALMTALALQGQRNAALAQYDICREILQTELNVAPNAETMALFQKIRDGALGWEGDADTPPPNPYQGLQPFGQDDAFNFFGREAMVARLIERLGVAENDATEHPWETHFVALIGASGSGKSSVVQAGLIPTVRRLTQAAGYPWLIAQMRPGDDPIAALAAALADCLPVDADADEISTTFEADLRAGPDGLAHILATHLAPDHRLLLIVDQAEEFFTLVPDSATLDHVSALLLSALQAPESHLRQVTVMRADYYALPLNFPQWGQLFQEQLEVMLPLTPEALRRTIVGPAERLGVSVAPELVAQMITDAGQRAGGLPLLQYTLTELFKRREGNQMTLQAYKALGGIAGALAQRAEVLYHRLDVEEREAARRLFLHMVVPQEEGVTVRRRVPQSALLTIAPQSQVALDAFGAGRMLTFDRDAITGDPTVEIAHETLIEAWERLHTWVAEAKETLYRHRRLESLAETWERADRDPSYLLRGQQLTHFETFPVSAGLALSASEIAYLDASLHAREQHRAAEIARQAHEADIERRNRLRLRWLVIMLSAAFVVTLALSVFALHQQRIAQREAAVAQSLNLATSAQLALTQQDTDLALALALAANQLPDPPPQARLMLADAAYAPGTRRVFEGHTGPVEGLAISSDGRTALSASVDTTLILWNLETGEMIRHFTAHQDAVHGVALHPNKDTAISASADGTLIQWDLESGQVIRRFTGHTGGVWCVAITPDGRTALSGAEDGTLILWDIETGQALRRFTGHSDAVLSVAISPDGRTALSGSRDRSVIVWDIASGEIVHHFVGQEDVLEATAYDPRGHFDAVWGVAFSPDGQQAISASYDEHTMVWDLTSGERIKDFIPVEMTASIFSMAVSPDGRTALLGMLDNRVGVLDLTQGKSLLRLLGHTGRVQAVAFTPDGRYALSGSADGTLRLWDLQSGAERQRIYGTLIGPGVDLSPDGRTGLAATWTGDIWLWDVERGEMVQPLQGHTDMLFAGAYFTPDGKRIVSGAGAIFGVSEDNTVRVWDIASGEEIWRFEGHTAQVWDVAISPDGRYAASGAHDGTLRLWDLETGEGRTLADVSPQAVRSVAFSPACVTSTEACEPTILVGLAKGQSSTPNYDLRLLDVTTGQEIRRFEGHDEVVADIAFSPDGRLAVSGASDKQVILWETTTGRPLHYLTGHAASVQAVAFSPDGGLIASAGMGQVVFLWETATGTLLRHLVGHTEVVLELRFTSDGKTLVSVSDDDTIRAWQVDASQDALIDWVAANRHTPELTCQQRAQYRIEPLCATDDIP